MSVTLKFDGTTRSFHQTDIFIWPALRFLSAFGVLLFLVSCGGGGGGSSSTGTTSSQQWVSLVAIPASVTTYPSSDFTIVVQASTNTSAVPAITSTDLPSGITAKTTFPVTVPSAGASITFQTDSTAAAGSYTITLKGTAGSATGSLDITTTVVDSTPPSFFFVKGGVTEVGVPIGGSAQTQFKAEANGPAYYDVQLSLKGLPPGTTGTVSPQTIIPGQTATVTIAAANSAPETQNTVVTLTGTPVAPIDAVTATFLVDVTPPPGSLPENRTDYVSTSETPNAAVYDPSHQLIFASIES